MWGIGHNAIHGPWDNLKSWPYTKELHEISDDPVKVLRIQLCAERRKRLQLRLALSTDQTCPKLSVDTVDNSSVFSPVEAILASVCQETKVPSQGQRIWQLDQYAEKALEALRNNSDEHFFLVFRQRSSFLIGTSQYCSPCHHIITAACMEWFRRTGFLAPLEPVLHPQFGLNIQTLERVLQVDEENDKMTKKPLDGTTVIEPGTSMAATALTASHSQL